MKQMIVMRTDLRNTKGEKVRTGKMVAQGAHASLGAVLPILRYTPNPDDPDCVRKINQQNKIMWWLAASFTKITLGVGSEGELLDVVMKAHAKGLITKVIADNGLTEFGGDPTITCAAIGPDTAENIDPITGHLKLL